MNKIETAKNKLNISAILFTYGVPINEAKQIVEREGTILW